MRHFYFKKYMKLELSIMDDAELRKWIKQLVQNVVEQISKDDLNEIINKILDNKLKEVEKRVYDTLLSAIRERVSSEFIRATATAKINEIVTTALSAIVLPPKGEKNG